MTPTNGKTQKTNKKSDKNEHPSGDPRFKMVDRTIKRFSGQRDGLLEVLNTAQETFGFLSEDLLIYVSNQLRVPLAKVYGVSTFYHLFTFEPLGDHTCIVCTGTACYVKGSEDILQTLKEKYGIEQGQTTPDGKFSVSTARCLGSCGLAPVLVVDGKVVGKATSESTLGQIEKLLEPVTA